MGIQPREMFATVGAGLLGVASSLINGLLSKVAGVVPSISLRAVLKMVSKSFEQGVAERTGSMFQFQTGEIPSWPTS